MKIVDNNTVSSLVGMLGFGVGMLNMLKVEACHRSLILGMVGEEVESEKANMCQCDVTVYCMTMSTFTATELNTRHQSTKY
jgi:hypothetical protein